MTDVRRHGEPCMNKMFWCADVGWEDMHGMPRGGALVSEQSLPSWSQLLWLDEEGRAEAEKLMSENSVGCALSAENRA